MNPNASAGSDFRVKKTNAHTLTIESGDMTKVSPDPQQAYYLRDDRLDSLTNASHDYSLLDGVLQSVYIKVEPWSPNPPNLQTFTRNLDFANQKQMRGAVTNSAAYWNVALLAAFEAERDSDHDPTDENATSGRCSPTDQPVAAIFYEMIRDFQDTDVSCNRSTVSRAEYQRGTVAHESLHALTLGHDGDHTGALMCATLKNDANEPNRNSITAAQKTELRGVTQPRADLPIRDTCPTRTCKP